MDQYIYREYARAPRGEKAFGEISGKKYKRTSIVAGRCGNMIFSPLSYSGTTDHILFEYWFENFLMKDVSPGSVIILDNATFHRKAALAALAERYGCSVLFLPPYSPDLNPIENFWAWLKRKLQSILTEFDTFDDALSWCFKLV